MNPTQELFNIAVTKIIEQGEGAYDPDKGACLLRTHDGLRCAVGHVIDDEHYTPELEQKASPVWPDFWEIRRAISKSHPELDLDTDDYTKPYWRMLADLQSDHDDAAAGPEDEFIETFLAVAQNSVKKFNLEMPDV